MFKKQKFKMCTHAHLPPHTHTKAHTTKILPHYNQRLEKIKV